MMRRFSLAAAAVALVAVSTTSSAQSCNVETPTSPGVKTCNVIHNLSATVVETAQLALSAASTTIPTPNVAEYVAGETGFGAQILGPNAIAKSNKNYTVTFTYPATFTAPGGVTKNASDVQYSVNAGAGTCNATYTTLPGAPAAQDIFGAGTPTASVQKQVCFKLRWHWASDAPGSYTLPLTFTISAP